MCGMGGEIFDNVSINDYPVARVAFSYPFNKNNFKIKLLYNGSVDLIQTIDINANSQVEIRESITKLAVMKVE